VCAPQVDPTNLCGVYKNTIAIYGRHLENVGVHLLDQIKETLKGEQERLAEDGLVRLTTLDDLTRQNGVYETQPTGIHALSFAAKAAVVIVLIALLAAIGTFAVYLYLERQSQRQAQMPYPQKSDKKISSNSTVGCEEASQLSEKVGLRDGTAVVLEGGRPVVIEFDQRASDRSRDTIEEERSANASTIYSVNSSSQKHVPRSLHGEECKEPESYYTEGGSIRADHVQPADPMSIASFSEYTAKSEKSKMKRSTGELI